MDDVNYIKEVNGDKRIESNRVSGQSSKYIIPSPPVFIQNKKSNFMLPKPFYHQDENGDYNYLPNLPPDKSFISANHENMIDSSLQEFTVIDNVNLPNEKRGKQQLRLDQSYFSSNSRQEMLGHSITNNSMMDFNTLDKQQESSNSQIIQHERSDEIEFNLMDDDIEEDLAAPSYDNDQLQDPLVNSNMSQKLMQQHQQMIMTNDLLLEASSKLVQLQSDLISKSNESGDGFVTRKAKVRQSEGIYSQFSLFRNNLEGGNTSKSVNSKTKNGDNSSCTDQIQNQSLLKSPPKLSNDKTLLLNARQGQHSESQLKKQKQSELQEELYLKKHKSILMTNNKDLFINKSHTFTDRGDIINKSDLLKTDLERQSTPYQGLMSQNRQFQDQQSYMDRVVNKQFSEQDAPTYCQQGQFYCKKFDIDDYNEKLKKKFNYESESDFTQLNNSDDGNRSKSRYQKSRKDKSTYNCQNKWNDQENLIIKRKSGHQVIPIILTRQSNLQRRNKKALQKLMPKNTLSHNLRTIMGISTSTKSVQSDSAYIKDYGYISEDFSDIEPQEFYVRKAETPFQIKKESNESYLIVPDSVYRVIWDILLLIMIVYQAIHLPLKMSFQLTTTETMFILEFIIDISFLLDILLNFNTGFYIKSQLIMRRLPIAKEYTKKWFWVDLVSSIPYTWIFSLSQGLSLWELETNEKVQIQSDQVKNVNFDAPQLMKLLKIARMLKMLKLLRIMKLKKILIKFEEHIVTDSMDLVITFLTITTKIIVIAHYMACIFYYFGLETLDVEYRGWIQASELLNKPVMDQYITTMYWAFTTMSGVGYGDIHPITKVEREIGVIMIVLSCGIFAYAINSIGNIVSRFNLIVSTYKERMMYANRYMIERDVPQKTRIKIRRYLDYVFESKKEIKIEEAEIFKMLSEGLKDKIKIHLRGRILVEIPFLQGFGLDFLSDISVHFEKFTFIADDFIFVEGDRSTQIIYILSGKVAMVHKQTHSYIKDVKDEEYFGQIGVLKEEPRSLSAKARNFTETYRLNKQDLQKVSQNYVQALQQIDKIKTDLCSEKYSLLKMKCYLCDSYEHIALKCPKFAKCKGNLMKMYLKQINITQNKGKPEEEKKRDLNSVVMEKEIAHEKVYYIEIEKQQSIQHPSEESLETQNIKTKCIRKMLKHNGSLIGGQQIMEIFEYPKKVDDIELDQLIREHKDMQIAEFGYNIDSHLKHKSKSSPQRNGSSLSLADQFSQGKYKRGSMKKRNFCKDTKCTDGHQRSNTSDQKIGNMKKTYFNLQNATWPQEQEHSGMKSHSNEKKRTQTNNFGEMVQIQQYRQQSIPLHSLAKIKEEEIENDINEQSKSPAIDSDSPESESGCSCTSDDDQAGSQGIANQDNFHEPLQITADFESHINIQDKDEEASQKFNQNEPENQQNWQDELDFQLLNNSQELHYTPHLKKLKATVTEATQQQQSVPNTKVSRPGNGGLNLQKQKSVFFETKRNTMKPNAQSRESSNSKGKKGGKPQKLELKVRYRRSISNQQQKDIQKMMMKTQNPRYKASVAVLKQRSEKKSDYTGEQKSLSQPWREYYKASENTSKRYKKPTSSLSKTRKAKKSSKTQIRQTQSHADLIKKKKRISEITQQINPKSEYSKSLESHEIDQYLKSDNDAYDLRNKQELAIFLTSEQNQNYSLNMSNMEEHQLQVGEKQVPIQHNLEDTPISHQIKDLRSEEFRNPVLIQEFASPPRQQNAHAASDLGDIVSTSNMQNDQQLGESQNSFGLGLNYNSNANLYQLEKLDIQIKTQMIYDQELNQTTKGFKPNKTIIGPNGTLQNYIKPQQNIHHLSLNTDVERNNQLNNKQLNEINRLLSDDSLN